MGVATAALTSPPSTLPRAGHASQGGAEPEGLTIEDMGNAPGTRPLTSLGPALACACDSDSRSLSMGEPLPRARFLLSMRWKTVACPLLKSDRILAQLVHGKVREHSRLVERCRIM